MAATFTALKYPRKPRILFMAEAVTLAHIARPAKIAAALDTSQYDIFFATAPRYNSLFPDLPGCHHELWSIDSEQFLNALAKGKKVYSQQILEKYVIDDLNLIGKVNPDLIIGDFRLSLSVSARVKKIPYAAISNAYWTVYAQNKYTVPELPITRLFKPPIAQLLFSLARPFVFASHCTPLNRIRKNYGLPSLGHDLRAIYSDADQIWLADMAEYFPIFPEDVKNVHYLGPLPWSPSGQTPPWWDKLKDIKPIVYVTLGSSGQINLLPLVLTALSTLPVNVIAVTAGRTTLPAVPNNVLISDFLPGDQAAARASLVICNGGSLSTYQAIQGGTKILAIASNLDQYLNMSYIIKAGLGETIRAGQANISNIRASASHLLAQNSCDEVVTNAQTAANNYSLATQLPHLIQQAIKPAQ